MYAKRILLRSALAASALIASAAACSSGGKKHVAPTDTGYVFIETTYCGANCGKHGTFHQQFFQATTCTGTPFATLDAPVPVELNSNLQIDATPVPFLLKDGLDICATVYFDVNTNGTLDAGDAIPLMTGSSASTLTGTGSGDQTLVLGVNLSATQ